MLRLIVTDYDGTLVPKDRVLSNELYVKLNKLKNRGITFAVASGRPYNQLKKLLFQASNDTVFIANDGAQVMYRNCILYKLPIETATAKVFCQIALECGFTAICALREENRSVKPEQLLLPSFFSTDIFKIIIVKDGKNGDALIPAAQQLGLRVCFNDDQYIEFCHQSANKGEAVKKLMQKFSIAPADAIIAGDGINDIPMLGLTSNRIFPATAHPTVTALGGTTVESVEDYIISIK